MPFLAVLSTQIQCDLGGSSPASILIFSMAYMQFCGYFSAHLVHDFGRLPSDKQKTNTLALSLALHRSHPIGLPGHRHCSLKRIFDIFEAYNFEKNKNAHTVKTLRGDGSGLVLMHKKLKDVSLATNY